MTDPFTPQHALSESTPVVDESVIHDLLNPLTAVVGNLHLLEDLLGADTSPLVHKRLVAGVSSGDELRDMLENLRYLMSPAEAANVKRAAVDLAAMLERQFAGADNPPTVRTIHRPVVQAQEQPLRRAIDVLIRAATRIGTTVTWEIAAPSPSGVEARIIHRGKSLPPALATHVFDPDFAHYQAQHGVRIDRARGLRFVSAVVEVHGGSARYVPEGEGGAFVLHLPT